MTETSAPAEGENLSAAAAALVVQMRDVIGSRINAAMADGNAGLAEKWGKELHWLTTPKRAEALAEAGFDAGSLSGLAIYATQKVRRLVGAYVGEDKPDPFTVTLVCNARAFEAEGHEMANRLMNAALSRRIKLGSGERLADRRAAAESTAVTQASSSRQALIALGAGEVRGTGRERFFRIRLDHPFVARIAGA